MFSIIRGNVERVSRHKTRGEYVLVRSAAASMPQDGLEAAYPLHALESGVPRLFERLRPLGS